MKADDHSLTESQYQAVHAAAARLLDRGEARGRFPTPVSDLMAAAKREMAPLETFDDSSITGYLAQLKTAATGAASKFLRSAIEKVRGVLDVHARTVHVDTSVTASKQRFLKLHETGHAEIPHQSGIYRFVQDCWKTLSSDVASLFEREANSVRDDRAFPGWGLHADDQRRAIRHQGTASLRQEIRSFELCSDA